MRQVFIDTETGGLDPKVHGLTEVALVCFDLDPVRPMNCNIVDKLSIKIKFNDLLSYSPIALNMQHRQFGDNADAISEEHAISNILHFLESWLGPGEVRDAYRGKLVAQYAEFDWGFIRELFGRHGFDVSGKGCPLFDSRCDWVCTRHLFRFLRTIGAHNCQGDSMKNILPYYGIVRGEEEEEHSAFGDAMVSIRAYQHMLNDLKNYYGGVK